MKKPPIEHTTVTLRKLLLSQKGYLALGLIGLFVNKGATVAIPLAAKTLIDKVIAHQNTELLIKLIGLVSLIIVLQAVASYFTLYILGVRAQKLIAEMRTEFYQKTCALPLSFFKEHKSGEIVARILKDFESVRVYIGTGFIQLLGGVLTIVFAIILMLFISIKLTLILIVPIVFFGLITFFIFKNLKPGFHQKKKTEAFISGRLTESFRGIRVIKLFNAQDFDANIIRKHFFKLYEDIKKVLFTTNLIIGLATFFMGITSIILIWFGSHMIFKGELSLGELLSFMLYLGLLIAPAIQISRISSQVIEASSSVERINEIYALENENLNRNKKLTHLKGDINLKNISFSYDTSRTIIDAISLEILPGKITAIVGKSGAGKSTLLDLITGLEKPNKGEITIDGLPLAKIDLCSYRSFIGAVFQESLLFDGTIKDNILLGKPTASEKELIDAIEKAQLNSVIQRLPYGIDSFVGENGAQLSEGEKQRVCIARAFLADPKLLLLDEATSNLDMHNEKLITKSIELLMQDRTVIVIAHRLSTIQKADQIILLEHGKIAEKGTHEELLQHQQAYYSLYHSL